MFSEPVTRAENFNFTKEKLLKLIAPNCLINVKQQPMPINTIMFM